jgi:6-pyruvoyl tetrahydropterin synthase-related domain|uniref:6-carboxytetrahydropterin synthase n=1 Tax=Roseburia sp. TaxID=2049040 RepID=UPI003FEE6CAF
MDVKLYREYKFKFYLNASHYIIINGKQGQTHPHTWEFMVCIMKNNDKFVQFNEFERAIESYFEKYQNRVMNEMEPFDVIVPTLENMADYFVGEIRDIVRKIGGELIMMESSETPTRSYILGYQDDMEFIRAMERNSKETIDFIIESVVDGIIE